MWSDPDVRFSNRVSLSSSVFPSFVVITAWVTLLYVVGLAMAWAATSIGRIGLESFALGGDQSPVRVNNSRKHGDQFPSALPPTAHIGLKGTNL